ncbi:MAG TPA: hypothetical protein VFS43_35730 [Polyangiaceae bacterium]|nr:hypothetical protein [Polyangiaceae bacterium]
MASEIRKIVDKIGQAVGRAESRGHVRLTAGAFEALVRLAWEAADEAREQGVPDVEVGVA